MNQNDLVLRHLKRFGKITTMTAFNRYGITRLSGRIFELREQGYAIKTGYVVKKNRFGKKIKFAEYVYVE